MFTLTRLSTAPTRQRMNRNKRTPRGIRLFLILKCYITGLHRVSRRLLSVIYDIYQFNIEVQVLTGQRMIGVQGNL